MRSAQPWAARVIQRSALELQAAGHPGDLRPPREDMPVRREQHRRDPRQPRGHRSENPRFIGVRMDDVRPFLREDPRQPDQRRRVLARRDVADQFPHHQRPGRRRFRSRDQRLFVLLGGKPVQQAADDLVCPAADAARDDLDDAKAAHGR